MPEQSSQLQKTLNARKFSKLQSQCENADSGQRYDSARCQALIQLGKSRDVRAIEILSEAATDSTPVIRQAASTGLGALRDSVAVRWLLPLLLDPVPEVAREAMRALGQTGDPSVLRPVMLAGRRDPMLRALSVETVISLGSCVMDELLNIAQSDHPTLAEDAIPIVARIPDPRCIPVLLDVIDSNTGRIRVSAVRALGRISDETCIGRFVRLLDDPESEIRLAAVKALYKTPDARIVRPLMGILTEPNPTPLRQQAVRTLGMTGDPRVVPAIARQVESADDSFLEVIAESLGQIGDRAAARVLHRMLRTPSQQVLAKVLAALRLVGTAESIPVLIPLLQNPSPTVRRLVVEVLTELKPDDGLDLFSELLLNDQSPEVRATSAKALGRMSDRQAIPLLEKALQDDPFVRCAAVISLTTIGEQRSVPALLAMLKDPAPEVRYHAATGLGKLKAISATRALTALLEDPDSMVQTGAARALQELGIAKPRVAVSRRLAAATERLVPNHLIGMLPGGVRTLAITPVAIVALTGLFFLFGNSSDAGTDLGRARIMSRTAEVRDVAWLADSGTVILLRSDGACDLWQAQDAKFVRREQLPEESKFAYAAQKNALLCMTGAALSLWSDPAKSSAEQVSKLPALPSQGQLLVCSRDAGRAVVQFVNGQTIAWDVTAGEVLADLPFARAPQPAISGDGRIAAGLDLKTQALLIYDIEQGSLLTTIDPAEAGALRSLALNADGSQLIGSASGHVCVFDFGTSDKPKPTKIDCPNMLTELEFLAGPQAFGTGSNCLVALDLAAGQATVTEFSSSPIDASRIGISPDGRQAVIAAMEHKSGWLAGASAEQCRELSPFDLPEDVYRAQ